MKTTTEKQRLAVDRIEEIANNVGALIPGLILDMRDQITEAINAAVEDSQESESNTPKKATLSIPISVKWDLDGKNVELAVAVAVKRKARADFQLDDPNQPGLPGVEGGKKKDPLLKVVDAIRRAREIGMTDEDILVAVDHVRMRREVLREGDEVLAEMDRQIQQKHGNVTVTVGAAREGGGQ